MGVSNAIQRNTYKGRTMKLNFDELVLIQSALDSQFKTAQRLDCTLTADRINELLLKLEGESARLYRDGDGCATWPDNPQYKGAEYTATVKAETRKKFADEMQIVRDRKFRAKWQDIYDNDQQDLY